MRPRSVLRFAEELARTYAAVLPKIAYLMTLAPAVNPRNSQKRIHQILNAIDLEDDDPVLGSKDIEDVLPGHEDVQIIGPYYSRRSSEVRNLIELACLAHIVRKTRPRLIFEFGTFIGRTTRLLAANAGEGCRIFTLDLPQEIVTHSVGADYRSAPEAVRITQLFGDSTSFDYSNWSNECDFVWVDACHDYKWVLSDTRNALELCRPGGWIGWHDYRHSKSWSGVTRAIRALKVKYPDVFHLRGTTIALLKKP